MVYLQVVIIAILLALIIAIKMRLLSDKQQIAIHSLIIILDSIVIVKSMFESDGIVLISSLLVLFFTFVSIFYLIKK